jgi:hypothetical protein
MVDDVGVAGGGVAICTAGEEEGDEVEAEVDEASDAEISAHAELSGAADVLYSHRVITDLEPLAMSNAHDAHGTYSTRTCKL